MEVWLLPLAIQFRLDELDTFQANKSSLFASSSYSASLHRWAIPHVAHVRDLSLAAGFVEGA